MRARHLCRSCVLLLRSLHGVALGLLIVLVALTGCRYPTDIEHSSEKIQGGVLDVGVTENPPWVIRTDKGPAGLEPELIKELAEKLDADVRWHWGSEGVLVQALKEHQLDLLIGGITKDSSLSKLAALSKPYYRSIYTVGYPETAEVPASLDGERVAIRPVNHFINALREEGAVPERQATPAEAGSAVAAPVWWLKAHGYQPGPWELAVDEHVMVLPNGENGWMLTIQRHISSQTDIGERLQQLEADR